MKIDKLLEGLQAATFRSEKQSIRRQLRALGHEGGLNLPQKPAKK